MLNKRLADQDAKVGATLDRIGCSIVRCDAIINNLLDFSRDFALPAESIELDLWLDQFLGELERPDGGELVTELASRA